MDDDSKQILILKLVVGFLVFLAIMIFIIIIFSIKNANKKTNGLETTTRRTLSGEVTEDITTTSWFSEETTTSSEATTTTSEVTTTQAPTTTKAPVTTRTTRKTTSGGGGGSGSGGSSSEIPSFSYTIINSSDATSYHNADNSMEWALVNKINQNTNNKYSVALELRTAAERIAEVCCESPGLCESRAKEFVKEEIQLTSKAYADMTSSRSVDFFYGKISNNELLKGNYKYIGVGFYRVTNQTACAAWVVDGD